MHNSSRQFIRHPTTIPIEFSIGGPVEKFNIKDIRSGGLGFSCCHSINSGELIHIIIPIFQSEFDAKCIVRWSK